MNPDYTERPAILTERRGATCLITINRPEVRNAIDGPTAIAWEEGEYIVRLRLEEAYNTSSWK